MYESFFLLNENPFNLTPDPRFVYFSRHHQEALSSLIYGVETRRGFIQITGEIGAGKTTLSRTFLKHLEGKTHSALVLNPQFSELELIQMIVEDFGITPNGKKKKDCLTALNRFLLDAAARGCNAVVLIDEAQLVKPKALEQIRLLSNLETDSQKLLQIVLIGQPELKDILNRPGLRQLKERIAIRFHLPALPAEEVSNYLEHRLRVAGASRSIFIDDAVRKIAELSAGIPRRINLLADRAMMVAFTQNSPVVHASMVEIGQCDLEGVRA